CSVGPPPSAIHGRGRLPPQQRKAAYRQALLFDSTHFPVEASLLAMDVNDNACCLNERDVRASIASRDCGGSVKSVERVHLKEPGRPEGRLGSLFFRQLVLGQVSIKRLTTLRRIIPRHLPQMPLDPLS